MFSKQQTNTPPFKHPLQTLIWKQMLEPSSTTKQVPWLFHQSLWKYVLLYLGVKLKYFSYFLMSLKLFKFISIKESIKLKHCNLKKLRGEHLKTYYNVIRTMMKVNAGIRVILSTSKTSWFNWKTDQTANQYLHMYQGLLTLQKIL